jgi:hypothetical protein
MTATTIRAATIASEPAPIAERSASRRLGGLVAVAIAAPIGIGVLAFADTTFFLAGTPAAGIAGVWLGPKIRSRSSIAVTAVSMALLTIVLAEIVVCAWAITAPGLDRLATADAGSLMVGTIYLAMIGLVIVGIPMLMVTVPCGLAWAWIVRRLVR